MIKNPGGIFNRNASFNNVDVGGDLIISGDQYFSGNLEVNGSLKASGFVLSENAIVTENGTSRNLSSLDNGKVIYCTSASPVKITCTIGLGDGFSCKIIQGGVGKVTVDAGAATLRSPSGLYSCNNQYSIIGLICPVPNVFFMEGDFETSYLLKE